jgi:hypothetical protein
VAVVEGLQLEGLELLESPVTQQETGVVAGAFLRTEGTAIVL